MKNGMGRNFWQRLAPYAFGCMSLLAIACGSDERDSSGPNDAQLDEPGVDQNFIDERWTAATFDGRYDPKTGRLELRPRNVQSGADTPGLSTQAHQTVPDGSGANQIQFITESFSAPNTNCGGFANSFCADVSLKSHYTRRVELTWVAITNLSPGVTIRNGDAVPAALTGYVASPAFNYGTLVPETKVTKQWVFGVPDANPFTFTATIKAAPPRTAYNILTTNVFVDACALPGSVTVIGQNDSSSAVNVSLPFPFSIYDRADITGTISVRGVFSLGSSGPFSTPGTALPSFYLPYGSAAVFWEQLRTRPTVTPPEGRVCRATQGVFPTRSFYVTWENMRFQGGDGVPIMIFTVRLVEGTDVVNMYFKQMGNPVNPIDRTRGSRAVSGIQGYTNPNVGQPCTDANACKQLFAMTPFLPAAAAQYPINYRFVP